MITEDMVRSALKNVYDPEIGVDVVNLGLIYNIDIYEQGKKVDVDMTLTTPACPIGPMVTEQINESIGLIPGVKNVDVAFTFDPPWTPEQMSDEARADLGLD